MSNLSQKLTEDMKAAMKGGDSVALSTIKLLISAVHGKEIEKRTKLSKEITDAKELEEKSRLSDEEVLGVIFSEIKKHKDSITAYEIARPELAEKEKQELEILKRYAPAGLSAEEIRMIVKSKIVEMGAASLEDFGRVMGKVTAETRGRADGALVKKIVEEELGGK